MRIVISGIGEMGSHLARMLSGNGHDITVIDSDTKALNELSNLADLITVEGDTTAFAVLRRAGEALLWSMSILFAGQKEGVIPPPMRLIIR